LELFLFTYAVAVHCFAKLCQKPVTGSLFSSAMFDFHRCRMCRFRHRLNFFVCCLCCHRLCSGL